VFKLLHLRLGLSALCPVFSILNETALMAAADMVRVRRLAVSMAP